MKTLLAVVLAFYASVCLIAVIGQSTAVGKTRGPITAKEASIRAGLNLAELCALVWAITVVLR